MMAGKRSLLLIDVVALSKRLEIYTVLENDRDSWQCSKSAHTESTRRNLRGYVA